MNKLIRAILGTTFVTGGLVVASVAAFAASSQSTAVTLVIPTAITCSGLASSYSQTLVPGAAPAPGGVNSLVLGTTAVPLHCDSNDTLGFHVSIQATNPSFVGSINPANSIQDAAASLWISTVAPLGGSWVKNDANFGTSPTTVYNTTSAGSIDFLLAEDFTIPAAQAADNYTNTETLLGTAN